MRGAIRKMIQPLLWRTYRWYLSKKRWYQFDGLEVCVYPSVFHPGLLISTKAFLSFIRNLPVKEKTALELGAGSGLIALWLSQSGAEVTASDINPAALQSIEESCEKNQLNIELIHSDLFDDFSDQQFDLIFINPPFYPQVPQNDQEKAFFCGEDFEYFEKLFSQLSAFVHAQSAVYMILTDDCDLERIQAIAKSKGWEFEMKSMEKIWGEQQLIYRLNYR